MITKGTQLTNEKKKTVKITDDETIEIHHMEKNTAQLALMLSMKVGEILKLNASFMIWNLFKGFSATNIDPNYTNQKQFEQSPWYNGLCKFKNLNQNVPLLHIDLHGRMNRVGDVNVDIGYKAMEKTWTTENGQVFVNEMKNYFLEQMNPILEKLGKRFIVKKDKSKQPLAMRIELKPKYEGFRGHNCDGYTMVHQSVMIGNIIAIQLELCTAMRRELMKNKELFNEFAACIAVFYKDIVSNHYWKLFHTSPANQKKNSIGKEMIKNEALDMNATKHLLKRINSLNKFELKRCSGKSWKRQQKDDSKSE